MKTTMILLTALLTAATINAQKKISGNGDVTQRKINTVAYDRIAITGFYDVFLVSGTEGQITVEGESNLIGHVAIEVQGGTLRIATEKGVRIHPGRNKNIKITVPVESLDGVSLTGSGDVLGKMTIKTDSFDAKLTGSGDMKLSVNAKSVHAAMTGSGDLTLSGSAGKLDCQMSGSGDLHASDLQAGDAEVAISGSGDCSVYCIDALTARVSGSGDIHYKGDPKRKDTKVSGSGSITKM